MVSSIHPYPHNSVVMADSEAEAVDSLVGTDPSGIDLSGTDLSGTDSSGTDSSGTDSSRADSPGRAAGA